MTREKGPYVLVQCDGDDWYVIPAARVKDWFEMEELDGWENGIPDWAEAVGGAETNVEFDAYRITR